MYTSDFKMSALANCTDPDKYIPRPFSTVYQEEKGTHDYVEFITCFPLVYTMDHTKFIAFKNIIKNPFEHIKG